MNIILIYFAIKYKGNWDDIYDALEKKERVSPEEITALEKKIREERWKFITILDKNYPENLKQAYKPPFVIWYKGNIKLLEKNVICVTGNDVTNETKERINKFIPELLKTSSLIVSMYYEGVDREIEKLIKKDAIYVLASGLDQANPKIIDKKESLFITEYPKGTKLSKLRCKERNRLTASFGNMLILFSSLKNGPINHLITNFLNLGKEVYCFPGDGSSKDGNSELIKQGANLITSIKDINSLKKV